MRSVQKTLASFVLLGATTLGFLCACSSDESTSSPATPPATTVDAAVTCTNDPRVTAFVANVSATSRTGSFKVAIASADPAPPVRGDNTWRLVVTNADGSPLAEGATISLSGEMPDHGHRSPSSPTVTKEGDGSYTVSPIDLFMPGVWDVLVTIRSGASEDVAAFAFCIAG